MDQGDCPLHDTLKYYKLGGAGRRVKKRSLGLLEVVPLLRLHQLTALAQVSLRHHQLLLLVHLALDRKRFHLAGYLLFGEMRTH